MKMLSVGIGCRLHSPAGQIEAAVRAALGSHAFDDIRAVASIDTKAGEAGLREFCARHALPLTFFSREQIAAVPVAEPSAAVREHLGADGVCEPCALLAAMAGAGQSATSPTLEARLVVRKTVHGGVTVAIAAAAVHAENEHSNNNTQEQNLP